MPNISSKTKAIATRIDIEVWNIIERRLKKSSQYKNVNEYIRKRIEYDTLRKHGKK